MIAHTVRTFSESAPAMPASMVAHTVTPMAAPDWKTEAFSNMNKNSSVHNVVGGGKKSYKIVMIRHGESEWNKENRFCGWFDAGLSDKGITSLRRLVQPMKENMYYHLFRRCRSCGRRQSLEKGRIHVRRGSYFCPSEGPKDLDDRSGANWPDRSASPEDLEAK